MTDLYTAGADEGTSEAHAFLSRLFAPYRDGFIEIRAIAKGRSPSVVQRWFPVGDSSGAADYALKSDAEGYDVYFGVLPREERKGDKGAVRQYAVRWADFDLGHDVDAARRAARRAKPDLAVLSGGGVHGYWFAASAKPFPDSPSKARFEKSLTAWYREIGADVSTADVARVLRVPGTHNHKPEYGRPCPAVSLWPDVGAPDISPLSAQGELALAQLQLDLAASKAEQEWWHETAWYWNAVANGDTQSAGKHKAELQAWRYRQVVKRDGLRIRSRALNADVLVVETIPFIPPGDPVMFEREELERLDGAGGDALRAVWEMKREFGGKWTGDAIPPSNDAWFAEGAER